MVKMETVTGYRFRGRKLARNKLETETGIDVEILLSEFVENLSDPAVSRHIFLIHTLKLDVLSNLYPEEELLLGT
jgi:hypothetical protein